jgi:hypothetical protein
LALSFGTGYTSLRMTQDLSLFVKEALLKGESRSSIKHALEKAGWEADEVRNALNAYADSDFPIPVPRRKPYVGAKEAFMYLLMFLTLYWSSFSFGQLLYQFINRAFPDALQMYYAADSSASIIRMDLASLIIAFPVFLWISWMLAKEIKKDPDKRASKIRKWLTYLTLFIAAGIIIGDLIALVFNVLAGDLTPRFVLKVLTVGGIAGAIFGYYLIDLRKDEKNA